MSHCPLAVFEMFFGGVVKPGQKLSLPDTAGSVFHLSQACLGNNATGKTLLKLSDENGQYNLCSLAKDKVEHASFDLFIPVSSNVEFSQQGPSEVHITGYFEPEGDQDNFDMDDEDEDSDVELGDELEEKKALMTAAASVAGKKLSASTPAQAAKRASKLAQVVGNSGKTGKAGKTGKGGDSDDSDLGDSDDDSDEEATTKEKLAALLGRSAGDGDLSSSEEGDSAEDEDEDNTEAVMAAVKAASKGKGAHKPVEKAAENKAPQAGQKRKAEGAAQQPPRKQQKTDQAQKSPAAKDSKSPVGNSEEDKYVNALKDYLKAHGRTPVSNLGSSVKKPAGVKSKLGQLIRERSRDFKIEGQFVSVAQ